MARINKYLGPTGLTELINLIQADFQKKQDWLQFPEMPDPALYTGKVVQYTGITDPLTFTKGFFYYSTGLEWAMVNTASAVEMNIDLYFLRLSPSTRLYIAYATPKSNPVAPIICPTLNLAGVTVVKSVLYASIFPAFLNPIRSDIHASHNGS